MEAVPLTQLTDNGVSAGGTVRSLAGAGDLEWLRRGRLPGLDGLRGIAVSLVLLAHAHQTKDFPRIDGLHWLVKAGPIGVEVFFVISGFLITTLMYREITTTGKL